jgi:peptidoglycan/LPS O-acetylase OafA/YrhL
VSERQDAARLPALDGIRGLAILFVALFHFTALVAPESDRWADEAFLRVTSAGWAGVDLFFVLSGFLITGILLNAKDAARHYFRNFYARRTLRIFPAYYGFLFLLALVLPIVQPMEDAMTEAVRDRLVWYATYLTNVNVGGDPILRGDFFLTSHLWSLAAEEQFYLVWPAVVFAFGRRSLMLICVVVIVVALALRIGLDAADVGRYVAHRITPARMDTLAVGALIALAVRERRDLDLVRAAAWPVAAVAGAALLAIFFSRERFSPFDAWVQTAGYTSLALVFGAVVLGGFASMPGTALHAGLSVQPLRFLGKYSYALYLVHWPAASLLARRTDFFDFVPMVAGSGLLREATFVAAAGTLSIAIAWLSWQVWESQWLKLKERFPYWTPQRAARLSS